MVRSYWRRVRNRAWQDTISLAGIDSRARLIWRLLIPISALVLIACFAPIADLKSRIVALLAATGAFAMVFFIFYSWYFLAAPAKLDKEAHDLISNLKGPFEDRERREQARKALWELREEGVKIRNDGLTTRIIDSWTKRFEQWHATVLEQAAILSMDLRHTLDPIDKISTGSSEGLAVPDPFREKRVSVMSEMLVRLYNYLDRTAD